MTDELDPVPPAGEDIHLPGPSIIPLLTAVAITMIVIGTTINFLISAVGVVLFVICLFRWVSDTSRDVAALPEEHQH